MPCSQIHPYNSRLSDLSAICWSVPAPGQHEVSWEVAYQGI